MVKERRKELNARVCFLSSGWMLGPFTAIYKMEGGAGFRGKGTERGIGNLYSSALDEEAKRSQVSLRVWGSGLE